MGNKAKVVAQECYQLRNALKGLSYLNLKYFVAAIIDEADKMNDADRKRKENKK